MWASPIRNGNDGLKQFDIFQVHRVKTQNEREKKFCKAIELKRYTKRRLIVEPLSNLDNGIQALGAVGKHTEKVRPVQLSMPDISSHLVTKYELEHHLDIFCFNRNGFNYPTMPSKSPCESKSTEKLLKKHTVGLRAHFWKFCFSNFDQRHWVYISDKLCR